MIYPTRTIGSTKTVLSSVDGNNAPHYKNIKTFPHHKHTKKGIEESFETTLEDVLSVIEKKIK